MRRPAARNPRSSWRRAAKPSPTPSWKRAPIALRISFATRGLKRLDHYAIFMENNARYVECCGAGERAGLYFTCINSYLTPDEVAYIVNNSESRVLIISQEKRATALKALEQCPKVEVVLVVDGPGDGKRILNLDEATAGLPATPIADESLGTAMLYSSGTTGRPKGILRPLPEQPPGQQLPLFDFIQKLWRYREGLVYLSPAPLYHSAPQAAVNLVIRCGGTAIIMERFDPERYLQLVEKYRPTHSQLVPTMFSRMLKLPEEMRKTLRRVVAGDRDPCRRTLPGSGQGADDRVVGTDHPRVLRRHRRPRLHRLRHRGVAGAQRHRRQGAARRVACAGRGDAADAERRAGHAVVQDRDPVRIFQRSGEDRRGALGGRHDEHGRRRRLRRRRRLPLPHRPRDLHDHFRRREHLSAGMREPADHPSQGAGCRRVRRAERGPRRGGQGCRAGRCPDSSRMPNWRTS